MIYRLPRSVHAMSTMGTVQQQIAHSVRIGLCVCALLAPEWLHTILLF
jgi:hypothetical protein